MSVRVRPVRLDSEKAELLKILERNLPDLPHARRFEWLYHRNPAGKAWSWFAFEDKSETPIGAASLFPRMMWIGESPMPCGQVGDFAVNATYRSLGPAVLLQKATFEPVNDGAVAMCYDCPPDDRGMSTFRRLGMDANCQMHRFARPLRIERHLARRFGHRGFARAAAFFGDFLLTAWPPGKKEAREFEIAGHADRFDEEFTHLDRRVRAKDSIRSRRSAADLNWRFRDDPLHQYRVLTARRHKELAGFLIASTRDEETSVIDLFGEPLDQVGLALLDALVEQERQTHVQSLHAVAAGESELARVLRKGRFRQREPSARIVAYSKPETETDAFFKRGPNWSVARMDSMA